jgi:hypothetical protein
MLSIIPLPAGFLTDILANVGTIMADLSPYITLIISIILIGVVLEIIIGAVKRH